MGIEMDDDSKTKRCDAKPLKYFFAQAGAQMAFTYLTSGVFLSGLAILMGAGDVLVSYLSVVVNICGVLILIFAAFLERFKSRKKLTIMLTVLSRIATLMIVIIPAVIPKPLQLPVFITVVVIAFALQAQTTVVLNQWMMGFVDASWSGRYISNRQTLTLAVSVVLSIAGGRFMDAMGGSYLGFCFVFAMAAAAGMIEIVLLARTPDKAVYCPKKQQFSLRRLIGIPLENRCFTGFVMYIFLFYLFLTIADSFTMVYLMKYLALPYQTVTGMYLLISLPQIFLLAIWGKVSDRYGHSFVLKTSIWLFAGETLFLFFASPGSGYLFIPIAFLIASVANAGFVVSVFNRRYELMPEENRIVYDNFYTAALGLGCILGPMIGGAIKGGLENLNVLSKTIEFAEIRLLYIVSTVGILVLQIASVVGNRIFEKNVHKMKRQRCK